MTNEIQWKSERNESQRVSILTKTNNLLDWIKHI